MPELPRNQSLNAFQVGDLSQLLEKPFHLRGVQQNLSGAYQAIGLAVGKSWAEHRKDVALAFPFAAEADPTDATVGTSLFVYPQARIWLDFTAPNGQERLTFRIWHRHVAYDDVVSFGPWTMWQEVDNAQGRREYLDSGNFHRQIYIQLIGYGPAAATATAVTVWVAGAEGIPAAADMDINIDAGNIEVQIEAIPDDFGEKADSAIMAGVTDGVVPQAAGGNPTGTFAMRVHPGGWVKNWLAEPAFTYLSMFPDLTYGLDRLEGQLAFLTSRNTLESALQIARSPYPIAARKMLGVDAGTVTVTNTTTLSFTGPNLLGRTDRVYDLTTGREHDIVTVVDPVGAAPGTITLKQPLWAATDTVLVPYRDVPHAWNSAGDAIQTMAIVGDPPRVSGPATLISTTAALGNVTTQYPFPCAIYGRYGVQIVWTTAAGTRTIQFNSFGKQDDGAWAAAGTIPAGYGINNTWQYSTGSTLFGAAAAGNGIIDAWFDNPKPFNSVMIEMVVTNSDGNNSTVTAVYSLYGGNK